MDNSEKWVILFSTADWKTPYWTNKQHTANEFLQRGYKVLFVESVGLRRPTLNQKDMGRIFRRLAKIFSMVRREKQGLWVFSPFVIPFKQRSKIVKTFNRMMMKVVLGWFCKSHKIKNPLVWTYHPMMLDLLPTLNQRKLIYHNVDNLSQAVPGMDSELIASLENQLFSQADVIFNTSRTLQDRAESLAPGKSHYFGNVADIEMFSRARSELVGTEPTDLRGIPKPRIVYVGVLSDFKLDLKMIDQIAHERPNYQWCFIGEEREGQRDPVIDSLKSRANVHFLGHKDYQEIPRYLRHMDVATLPTQINEYTKSMFPMKFFEYLAAGLDVVTTELPSIAEHDDLHFRAGTVDGFVRLLDEVLSEGRSRSVELSQIDQYSWSGRMTRMLQSMNET